MKMKIIVLLSLLTSGVFAQGPLQPSTTIDPKLGPVAPLNGSGAPQPTMRTLYQVEPRTPLVAGSPGVTVTGGGNITISQPGSYYLTANVTLTGGNGITINNGPVTIDLNGFTVSTNAAATGSGIFGNTGSTVIISNGNISCSGAVNGATGAITGSSFQYGINMFSSFQATVSKVNISGISDKAIYLDKDYATTIDSCTALNCVNGFEAATISSCTATAIGQSAIVGELVSNCVGKSYVGTGITGLLVNNSIGETKNTLTTSVASGIRADVLNAGLVTNSRGITGAVGLSNSRSINAHTIVGCTYIGESGAFYRYNTAPP